MSEKKGIIQSISNTVELPLFYPRFNFSISILFLFLFHFFTLSISAESAIEQKPARLITGSLKGAEVESLEFSEFNLTPEERTWLDDNRKNLVLFYDSTFPPIEFKSETGTFIGLGADIIARIEKILGISFIKKPSADWNKHLDALESGECAIAPTIVRTAERESYAFFTKPYIVVPVVLITLRGMDEVTTLNTFTGKRIGVVSGYASEKYLHDQSLLSRFEVVPVPNVPEGLQRVSLDEIDAFAENIASAAYYIEKNGILNLKVAGKTDFAFDLSIAVSRKYPLLYSSIQKALDTISESELAKLRKKWISLEMDLGFDPQTLLLLKLTGLFTGVLILSLAGITFFLKHRLDQKVIDLRKSEEFKKRVYESSRLPIIVMDAKTYKFLDCNQAAVEIYEYATKEEVLGKTPMDVSAPLQYDGTPSAEKVVYYINLAKNKGSVVFEWLHQRPDGASWDAEVHLLSFNVDKKQFLQFSCMDITQRKQAGNALRAERQFLTDMIDFLPDATFVIDPDHRVVAWNRAAESMTGVKRAELLGKGDYAYALPFYGERRPILIDLIDKTQEEIEKAYKYIRRKGTIIYAETFIQRLNQGKGIYLRGEATLLFDQFGNRTGAVEVIRDITENKQAEESLMTFKESLENSTDAIGMSTPQGVHYYQNKAFSGLFGNIAGYPPDTLFQDKTVGEEVFKTIMSGEKWIGEVKMYSKDGQVLDISLRAYANKDSNGKITALVGIHTDITKRKKTEAEHDKLQAQLAQSQKMESIGRLAGGVAHDFNNMLGVILGQTELVLSQVDSALPFFDNLQEIHKAAERSADLTRQLLAFARKQTVAPKVIDLNETVEGMLKMLKRLIGEDIDLVWHPGIKLRPVMMDPSQIDQILANLCVNARDAIKGVGRVNIETARSIINEADCSRYSAALPGEYILLTVSDDGCGMDQKTLSRLFEPFFTTKELGKGTGLGLATVYGIVRQNNGFIHVESEPDRGTFFKIYLPCHENKENLKLKEELNTCVSGQETILLVEDEPLILRMTKEMLKLKWYTVLSAATPEEALSLARNHAGKIHLLLTDVIMPGMNGRDLAQKLLSLHPLMKIIFMSGYTANVITDQGILDEGIHFIQKPFSMKDLASKVRETLDH